MRRLKRRIAGMMVGILCVINVLQPLCTYADELSQTSETVMEIVAESESVRSSSTEAEPETASDNSIESEPESFQNETETVETIAESETEPESVLETEPIHYTVSGTYSGQGHLTITDNFGNIYEIPEPEEEKKIECAKQSKIVLNMSPDKGYEIKSVEISQKENIESITDKEVLNASEMYEKTITVTADTKIKVTFEELTEAVETESETQSEVGPETESGLEE